MVLGYFRVKRKIFKSKELQIFSFGVHDFWKVHISWSGFQSSVIKPNHKNVQMLLFVAVTALGFTKLVPAQLSSQSGTATRDLGISSVAL